MANKTHQEERGELLQQTRSQLERGVKFSPLETSLVRVFVAAIVNA